MRKKNNPFIWAFIPYALEDGELRAQGYDTFQYKEELARTFHRLRCAWVWQPVLLGAVDHLIGQVQESAGHREMLVLNLCDGDEINGYPGITVVRKLEERGIPFTGADSRFYEISTSKIALKECFDRDGVATAPWSVIPQTGPVQGVCGKLGTPLFVKPSVSAGSFGLSVKSICMSDGEIEKRRDGLRSGGFGSYFIKDTIFVERFIDGPEFTVFVMGYWDELDTIRALPPAQRNFDSSIPEGERFLSYDRYWGIYGEETPPASGGKFYHYGEVPGELVHPLTDLSVRAYRSAHGTGYGRVDIRMDRVSGKLYVLEVNANCGLSGDAAETTMGNVLKLAGIEFHDLVGEIIDSASARHGVKGAGAEELSD